MNSHQRRKIKRQWPHVFFIYKKDGDLAGYLEWLNQTYGSCQFCSRKNRRWRYKIDWLATQYKYDIVFGASIFFRHKDDCAWARLGWKGGVG